MALQAGAGVGLARYQRYGNRIDEGLRCWCWRRRGSLDDGYNIARKVVGAFHQTSSSGSATAELSNRENEVLQLLAQGYLYKEIAENLKISVPTVNTYIRRIYEKLHVRSRAQAVAKLTHIPLGDQSRP